MLGVRGSLIRDDTPAAAAMTEAILEAQEFVTANPDEAAAIFAPYAPSAKSANSPRCCAATPTGITRPVRI